MYNLNIDIQKMIKQAKEIENPTQLLKTITAKQSKVYNILQMICKIFQKIQKTNPEVVTIN